MKADTKYFGQVEYDGQDVLHFKSGLFGFEDDHNYLLIPVEGGEGALLCLQSLETPQLAFTVMNPFFIKSDYAPVLQPGELRELQAAHSHELCYYVLCVIRRPAGETTVNLKCPVVINETTQEAAQVILESTEYQMSHPLSQFESKAGEPSC